MHRASDTGAALTAFQDEVLLRCPRCGAPAWSRPLAPAQGVFAPRRLVCTACACVRLWQERTIHHAGGECAQDDHFHLPLYLQTPCAHGLVWAYNPRHLAVLRDWLTAPLRSRRPDAQWGWANRSHLSRLPRWMQLAKHRGELAAALARLDVLAGGGQRQSEV